MGEINLPGGSFSRLLEDIIDEQVVGDDKHSFSLPSSVSHSPPPLFSISTPTMLCFGDSNSKSQHFSSTPTHAPLSSGGNNTHKNQNVLLGKESRNEIDECEMGCSMVGQSHQKNVKNMKKKKNKSEMGPITSSSCHAKAKREKLGERITSLQQLVSPYGKTDTASVLHEAMGYIRFLHDQVKVLSSPYLQQPDHLSGKEETKGRLSGKTLRSRGLCLVPVQCIIDVVNTNGADFWSSSTTSLSTP